MIARIYDYFGLVGVASILLWVIALAALVIYAAKLRRPRVIHIAIAIGVLAIVLAEINSAKVSEIQVLPEAPPAADAADKVSEKTLKTIQSRAAEIRFAEDDKAASTAAKKPGDADLAYDYRKAGKQTRETGRSLGHGDTLPTVTATSQPADGAATQPAADAVQSDVRRMSSIDVTLANRYDGMNLRLSRFTLFAAIVLLAIDYLRRFNLVSERLTPLPIPPLLAGFISQVFVPARRVFVARAEGSEALPRALAEAAVRKGESFVYFGAKDPWAESSLTKLPVARQNCRMDKLLLDETPHAYRPDFVADAVWFGRASAVVCGESPTGSILAGLVQRATRREAIEPSARRRINIIWDQPTPLPATAFVALASEATRQNLRMIVIGDSDSADRAKFDAVISTHADILGKPPLCERLLAAADRWFARSGVRIISPLNRVACSLLQRIDRSLSGPDRVEPIASSDASAT